MRDQGFPATLRVRKRRDFQRVYDEGYKVVTPEFALFAHSNHLEHSRLGVTASRRIGKAVRRNRARRLVREAFRIHRAQMPPGFDYVVVVRSPLLERSPQELGPLLVKAAGEAATGAAA